MLYNVAPQLSVTQVQRNLDVRDGPEKKIPFDHLRSMRHQVYRVREEISQRQLFGCKLKGTFGSLEEFEQHYMWSDMVRRHNDASDDFHIGMFDFCVIGHQTMAEWEVFRLDLSSPFLLEHAIRAIKAGWTIQLT
jgi:hypothetical protein